VIEWGVSSTVGNEWVLRDSHKRISKNPQFTNLHIKCFIYGYTLKGGFSKFS